MIDRNRQQIMENGERIMVSSEQANKNASPDRSARSDRYCTSSLGCRYAENLKPISFLYGGRVTSTSTGPGCSSPRC